MPKFQIHFPVEGYEFYEVEADTLEQALEKANEPLWWHEHEPIETAVEPTGEAVETPQ